MAEEDQRERFTEFCAKKYYGDAGDSCAAPRSKSISTKRGQQIINLLKDDSTVVKPGFRYWVKKKGFKLLSYPPLGLVDVLCLPAKKKVICTVHLVDFAALFTMFL